MRRPTLNDLVKTHLYQLPPLDKIKMTEEQKINSALMIIMMETGVTDISKIEFPTMELPGKVNGKLMTKIKI